MLEEGTFPLYIGPLNAALAAAALRPAWLRLVHQVGPSGRAEAELHPLFHLNRNILQRSQRSLQSWR